MLRPERANGKGGEGAGRSPTFDQPDACVACHSCELACSFHHLGQYEARRASVQIAWDPDSGVVSRWRYYAPADGRIACDECVDESERQCDKYCSIPVVAHLLAERRGAAGADGDGESPSDPSGGEA
ncbi:MAG TPA: hypothetical protein VJ787_12025 [Thermoleophilia bacterium]|nr:hypothetical protein [Thermoleophilia bacterium]